MVRCGSKNGYQNDMMCLKEIGICAQPMITILNSIVNMIGGELYNHLMSTRVFALTINKMFV